MFFDEEVSDTAAERYEARREAFMADGKRWPRLRHGALWLLHNAIVHPALGMWPTRITVDLHEVTSAWLNHDPILNAEMPEIPNRAAWRRHHVLAHLAIALLPCPHAFAWHDKTAEQMGVPGWV